MSPSYTLGQARSVLLCTLLAASFQSVERVSSSRKQARRLLEREYEPRRNWRSSLVDHDTSVKTPTSF